MTALERASSALGLCPGAEVVVAMPAIVGASAPTRDRMRTFGQKVLADRVRFERTVRFIARPGALARPLIERLGRDLGVRESKVAVVFPAVH